ncbi:tRNA lysidine(34) synthetase TilS [Halomonas qinghailakensis]|uniref:tRNA(Ile)-lysidine synthase n=2 Tax=Halomonas TaxID=2745 RepID=A0AA46TN20_9GAMM|nr:MULTISPECIES: tRNA lysidine(34) synthetase TilS [Halomonas]UYO73354.1 tRNA lysidine(34) synthetase TilS [Halomonas sp. ZZQ-149]UYV18549.1 tRNA lysidine(34) synthetase TilS [Halomonas qaidamensis]
MALQPPKPLLRLLNDALAETPPGRTIWVALSGGLDSSLLLTLAAEVCRDAGRPLQAIHINHGLQAAASAFEAHCLALCDALNVTLVTASVAVDTLGEGVEGAARRARYQAFMTHIPAGDTLWLAQHQDDQAETLLLAALRGSGVRGLAGMPFRRDWQGLTLLRPWLSISRQTLADAAHGLSISWCEDPTNRDIAFDRNRLRHQVMPALQLRWPDAARALANSAQHAGEADQLLASYAAEELATLMRGERCMDATLLSQCSLPRQRLLVRTLCEQLALPTPPQKRLESLLSQLGAASDAQVKVVWPGAEARMWQRRLYLMPPLTPLPSWEVEWDGVLEQTTPLGPLQVALTPPRRVTLRWRRGGEVIALKERGRRDIKRLLQERGIPPWERERLIVVMDGKVCLAVILPPANVLWQAEGVVIDLPLLPKT